MTTPADTDPATLAVELEAAWQAYADMKEEAERQERAAKQHRRLNFQNTPIVEAFGRICRSVFDAERGVPPETTVRDITREVKKAQRLRSEIERRQQEAK